MRITPNRNTVMFGRPCYNNDISMWLRRYEWTHILTLSQEQEGVLRPLDETVFTAMVKTFFFRMDEKVYGRGQWANKVKHVTFFENKTKAGVPTHLHSHSLIAIEPRFSIKFRHEAQKQWKRLKNNGIAHIVEICDERGGIDGASSYCAKYEHENALMFANMQDVREHNILPLKIFKTQ